MKSTGKTEESSMDYVIGVHDDPAQINAAAWNELLSSQASATPFMRHEYLLALHQSASAVEATGWVSRFLTVHRAGQLAAACPLYLKDHSYGEYVFDWAWADAYEKHGLRYYPKLLCAVPFTPVPGARLLSRDDGARQALLDAMEQFARAAGLSSIHLLFMDEADRQSAAQADWLLRTSVQFHWTNRHAADEVPTRGGSSAPYMDFPDFLATLQREKRKKIVQERRRVVEAGITFRVLRGLDITERDWSFFYRCYTLTYRAHHSTPYLTREFFDCMSATMPQHWLMFIAERQGLPVAASLIGIDPARGHAYGRYWGCTEHVPCLHFEACYYQPLQWCIEQRFRRFEGGAQGEHKMARGLLPVPTHSAHWLAHPQFARAVADFLQREGAGVETYVEELRERNPFKASPATPADTD